MLSHIPDAGGSGIRPGPCACRVASRIGQRHVCQGLAVGRGQARGCVRGRIRLGDGVAEAGGDIAGGVRAGLHAGQSDFRHIVARVGGCAGRDFVALCIGFAALCGLVILDVRRCYRLACGAVESIQPVQRRRCALARLTVGGQRWRGNCQGCNMVASPCTALRQRAACC